MIVRLRNLNVGPAVAMVVVAVAIALTGCALTDKGKYLAARQTFNDQVEDLTKYKDKQSPEKQAEMKANIGRTLWTTKAALDAWGLAIAGDEPSDIHKARWEILKADIVRIVKEYIGEKEEKKDD